MRRVLVIGIPGAGKDHLLASHLDMEYWQPGWTETVATYKRLYFGPP